MKPKNLKAWQNELGNYIQRAFQRGKGESKRKAREEKQQGKHLIHSKNTARHYDANVRQFADFLYQTGLTDVLKIKPAHSEEFIRQQIEKGLSAHTVDQQKQAIEKLQNAVAFEKNRRKVTMIDMEKIGTILKDAGKIRHADPTHRDRHKGAIITQEEARTMEKVLASSRSPNARVAATLERFQELSGGRVSSSLRMQVKDLNMDGNLVRFQNDKGGKTRVVHVDDETAKLFRELAEGKKPGTPLFTFRDRDGQIMSIEKAGRAYHRLIRNARERAGLMRESGAQITSHSFRKVYANELMERVKAAPLEKLIEGAKMISNDPNFRRRLNRETGGKITLANRWKAEQLIVSHALGHSRRDVLTFYLRK